jgi:CelD/BcsL family acetyltransferase involved in cellulose biosynthesis
MRIAPSDERWMTFAASIPDANIFHHHAWMDLLAACYGYHPFVITVQDEAGAICAGLPVMEVRSVLTGRRWVSLPYSDYCQPLYRDENAFDHLTDHLVQLSAEARISRVELRWPFPERASFTTYTHFMLHRLALCPDQKLIGRQLDGMHRQNIRVARKNGLRIEHSTDLDDLHRFYQLQLETRRRKGLPVQPWKYFQLIKEYLFDRDLGFVLLAYKGDDCLAGAIFLHWQQSLMCKYAASHEDALDLRPNNLLFWTGICWGCENDYKLFDMGRSSLANTGLRDFKTRWGADEVPLSYVSVAANPPSEQDGTLLRMLQRIVRNSPPWVCKTTGELLYRHFG